MWIINKDADQINTLKAQIESDSATAGKPLVIGLIGHTNITAPQAYACRQHLKEKLQSIKELQTPGSNRWVELMSPLAPGSDMALVDEAVKLLSTDTFSIAGLRLLIPYAVPWAEVDKAFRPHWEQNNQWLYHNVDYSHDGSDSAWAQFKESMQQERSKLINSVHKAGYPVEVVDLQESDGGTLSNHDGYIRAAQWIVEKSDVLIAVLEKSRKSTATDEWTDGGTGHSVAQWKRLEKAKCLIIDPLIDVP